MAAEEAELLQLQLPSTAVEVDGLETGTNLLLAPEIMSQRMAHFSEDVFDLSPESHLVRFVKVLLGDAGAGQLRKQYLMSRLQQTLHGSHFYDIDRFYGALFGVRRRSGEVLGLDPYSETADSEQWADEHAKDNSYRSRVMQFARAIGHGATPTGMELVAEAILNVDCDVYETWVSSDAVYRTYAELEAAYPTYATMEGVSYGTLEGFGLARIAGNERREFVVRPKRRITLEESYDLIRVLNRLKPADARVIVDYLGVQIHKPADIRGVYADSEYWEVVPHVVPAPRIETIYQIAIGQPTQQPRPPFSGYQGEAWSYCGDVVGVVAYFDRHGNKGYLNVLRWFASDGRYVDYEPDLAIMLLTNIHAGRAVSDAILVSHPYVGAREIPALAKMRIDSNGQVYNLVEEATKLPQLYADRIPLDRLTDKLERTNDIATPQADSYQRYWATVPRFREDDIQETLEVRLKDAKRINNISFEVSRYPHTVVAELYDEEGGDWVEVFRREVLDSYPTHPESVPTTQTTDDGPSHPHHRGGANHWVTCARKLDEPIRARRFRITLQRKAEGGIYPLRTGAVYLRSYLISFAHRTDIAYSLAVRNIDLGYRVKHKNDIKHWKFENKTIIETSVDIAGSLVEYTLHTQPAAGIIQAAPQVWRSEPQPVGYAVVNLYADTRTVAGEPQVIDRFYIDPVHSGVSMSIYYNDEEGLELESDDPVDDFEQMVWSPIARDYTLQKGYVEIPPTRARFFKFEFTNLVAEPYETLVPVTRRIKVFSKIVIKKSMPKRKGRGEKHLSTGIKIIVSGVFDGTQRFKDRFEFVFRPTRNDRRRRLSLNISVTAARFTYDLAAKIKLRGKSWTFGFHKHHLGHHAPKFIEKIQHTYDTIEIEHTSKVAYFVGIKELRAYRVDYQADDNTEMYVDLFQDFENIAEGFTWQFDPDTKLTTQSNITAEAHSKVMASRSPIAGVQFATQQSDAVQIAPDDDFRDAALANYDWDDPNSWHTYGDATLIYSQGDNSVLNVRSVVAPERSVTRKGGLIQRALQPVFSFRDTTFSDDTAVSMTEGGIESGPLIPAEGARIYAAARVTAETDLDSPLYIQIISNDGVLLVEKPATFRAGQMNEWWVPYDINSFISPPPPPTSFVQASNILDRTVQPTVTGAPLGTLPAPVVTAPDDSMVRIRVIQKGKADNSWRLDTLSLFDEGIIWEFSVDGGSTWWPARGIRNNANAMLTFPDPGTQLVWRVRGVRVNMGVSAIKIRPAYLGVRNARIEGIHRGPNVSTFDNTPPILEDPDFISWTKPVPRRWFYASKRNPILPVEGVPYNTEFSAFFGRPVTETATAADAATRLYMAKRQGDEFYFWSPTTDNATRLLLPAYREASDSAPASDMAVGHILPGPSGIVDPIPNPIP